MCLLVHPDMFLSVEKTSGLPENQSPGTAAGIPLKRENRVAVLLDRTRHVLERFAIVQANFGGLSTLHLVDHEAGFHERDRTDIPCDIEKYIMLGEIGQTHLVATIRTRWMPILQDIAYQRKTP